MRNVTVIDCLEERRESGDLMDILMEHDIDHNYVADNDDSFTVSARTNQDRDKLLSPSFREILANNFFKVRKPADYRAACTLVTSRHIDEVRCLSPLVFRRQFEEAANTKIDYVGMMGPMSYKIEFISPEEAQRILHMTVEFDDMIFPANSMETMRFIKVPQCSRCFSFQHERKDCTSAEFHCLVCGKPGHSKYGCPDKSNPKCKNCFGDHVAIAFKCPFRKVREYELDRECTSMKAHLLMEVIKAKRIAAGLDPDGDDREDEFDWRIGGPDPYATDDEEEESDVQQNASSAEGATAASSSAEGATALPTPSPQNAVVAGTSAANGSAKLPGMQEFLFIISESLSILSDQLSTRGYTSASQDARSAASYLRGDESDEEDDEEGQSSSSFKWRSDRVIRPPNPEEGEGPRRQFRRIPNYKAPAILPKKQEVDEYPVLPKRNFRRCANPENNNIGSANNPQAIS